MAALIFEILPNKLNGAYYVNENRYCFDLEVRKCLRSFYPMIAVYLNISAVVLLRGECRYFSLGAK